MYLKKVSQIPEKQWTKIYKANITQLLDEFMMSDADAAEVVIQSGEYTNIESLRESLRKSIRNGGYNFGVCTRDSSVYIYKNGV